MQQILSGIPNVINICDDRLIRGQSQKEHDIALNAVIERLVDKGLTLNKSKCKLNQTEVNFFICVWQIMSSLPSETHFGWQRTHDLSKALSNCNHRRMQLTVYRFYPWRSTVRCHPKRIEGIKKLQPPQNAADTLSFLSMMQYSSLPSETNWRR